MQNFLMFYTLLEFKEFYADSEWRPAVFGMTASPVATKGKSSAHGNHVYFLFRRNYALQLLILSCCLTVIAFLSLCHVPWKAVLMNSMIHRYSILVPYQCQGLFWHWHVLLCVELWRFLFYTCCYTSHSQQYKFLGYCMYINGCCFNMHRTWILCAHWISLLIIIFGAAIHPTGSYTWPIHWTKVVLWSMTASLGICFRTNCGRCTFWGSLTIAWLGSCRVWHGNPVRAYCHLGCQFYHKMDHAILICVSILLQPFIYWNPIFLSGASTIEDCEAQVVQLELILDAKVLSFSSQNFFSFEFSEFF